MEKVFLKPTYSEIEIKGSLKDGHTDVFSYDYYDDEEKRKLGGLYIIGNVKQDNGSDPDTEGQGNSPDIAYITNLVASLAKREYYSRPDVSPREAFSATLKKVNDVVEEFFKNKALKVNIGIFAVAGEQILISKLGKFKIILGRDSRVVDILNNIDLFSKDPAEDKEFSGIVSGKVMPGDKLFAFYPNRMITSREKTIRANLLKFDNEQFLNGLNSLKESKHDFECGALYLSLDNHKEPADIKRVKTAVAENVAPAIKLQKTEPGKIDQPLDPEPNQEPAEEVPRIISSEFSLGRKSSPFATPIKIMKNLYLGSKIPSGINFKRKLISFFVLAGILIVGVILIKTFVIIDPEKRQLNTVISQAHSNVKLAKTKISQNDFIGARQLLVDSLLNVQTTNIKNEKVDKTKTEIYEVLDSIDKATEISPTSLETMPAEITKKIALLDAYKGAGNSFELYENNLYVLASDTISKISDIDQSGKKEPTQWLKSGNLPEQATTITVDGKVYVMNKTGVLYTYYKGEKVSDANTMIVSTDDSVLMTSKNSDKLYLADKKLARIYEIDKNSGSLVRTLKIGSPESLTGAYLYGDTNIIVTTSDGRIWEVK